jgi:phosphoglycolate phosphatase-like HAD superfamily hydrolase
VIDTLIAAVRAGELDDLFNQLSRIRVEPYRWRRSWQVLEAEGKIYEAKYLASVKPFTGVRDVFDVLTKCGGKIALATDCKGPELKHYRSLLNVDGLIESIACGDDVEHGKPDPRLVGLALT